MKENLTQINKYIEDALSLITPSSKVFFAASRPYPPDCTYFHANPRLIIPLQGKKRIVGAFDGTIQKKLLYPGDLLFCNPTCWTTPLWDSAHEMISIIQIARNMCDMWDGFLLGKKYLIHDRDSLFHQRFDAVFESIGITVKKLPPFCPMMNSRCENFIRALKTECLDKIIFTSEQQLRYAVSQYLEYWNHYRPHAGLGGQMIKPYPQNERTAKF